MLSHGIHSSRTFAIREEREAIRDRLRAKLGITVRRAPSQGPEAVYERIVVTGRKIMSIRLAPSAYAHGPALALPDKVAMARPPVLSGWE